MFVSVSINRILKYRRRKLEAERSTNELDGSDRFGLEAEGLDSTIIFMTVSGRCS
jgi:hypothetical protein